METLGNFWRRGKREIVPPRGKEKAGTIAGLFPKRCRIFF
jgi:hypothetical protein